MTAGAPWSRVVLASGNAGKLAELQQLLGDQVSELLPQSQWGIEGAAETASTFIENALLKARHAARLSGLPALADDSGLCVAALAGAPGLRSARYAGPHGDAAANIRYLLDEMATFADDQRNAFFHCSIVLLRHADDPAPLIAQGNWHGSILRQPRGAHGFGYDPVFFDRAHDCSAAQLEPQVKNRISHRGQAMRQLRAALTTEA